MSGINRETLDVIVEAVSRVVTKRLDARFDEIVKRIDFAEKATVAVAKDAKELEINLAGAYSSLESCKSASHDIGDRIEGIETRQADALNKIDALAGTVEESRKEQDASFMETLAELTSDINKEIDGLRILTIGTAERVDGVVAGTDEIKAGTLKTIDGALKTSRLYFTEEVDNVRDKIKVVADKAQSDIEGLRTLVVETSKRVDGVVAGTDEIKSGTLTAIEGALKTSRLYFTEEVDNVRDKIQEMTEKVQSDIEESHTDASQLALELVKGNWQDTVALIEKQGTEAYLRVVDRLEEFRRASPGITDAKAWAEGKRHDMGITVRHNSGLWHCLKSTMEEPGEIDGEWVCLSTSISEIKVLDQHPNGTRATLGIYDSLGTEHRLSFDLPTFNFDAGTWLERGKYKQLDSVLLDGMRWVATKDNPQGQPGDSDDWVVLAMRGPAGKKGSTGRPGEQGDVGQVGPGPDPKAVESAVSNVFPIKAGNVIRAWRGTWQYGNKVYAGDLFKFKESFYLATRDSDGLTIPDITGPYWESLG